jgi:hypothetical protein
MEHIINKENPLPQMHTILFPKLDLETIIGDKTSMN